jgi:hypothetical protein
VSIINIIKLNNDTSTVNTITINKPSSQGSSYFAITNTTTNQTIKMMRTMTMRMMRMRMRMRIRTKYNDNEKDKDEDKYKDED